MIRAYRAECLGSSREENPINRGLVGPYRLFEALGMGLDHGTLEDGIPLGPFVKGIASPEFGNLPGAELPDPRIGILHSVLNSNFAMLPDS